MTTHDAGSDPPLPSPSAQPALPETVLPKLTPFADQSTLSPSAIPSVQEALEATKARTSPEVLAPGMTPRVRISGYEILRELGRGGMGIVYEARQEGLNRPVALKMILQGAHAGAEELARFHAEAQAIAKLQHANIVQVYLVGNHDGLPFIALEYCPGGSLAQRFASEGCLSPAAAAELIAMLARAVHAAHEAGIIHRDLKPGNVLLTKDGTPKVTDFGLAKQLDNVGDRTQSGAVLGTPSYMAPEQAAGHSRAVGPPTDVYALGAILYEALTGRPPFQAATLFETMLLVRTQDAPSPRRLRPDVPGDLEAIVLQCLEKNPASRYTTAAELAADLDRWRRGEPVLARRQSVVYRMGKRLRKHRRLVLAGALAVVLLFLLWFGLADRGYPVPGAGAVQQWLDRHEASVFRPVPSESRLRAVAADRRRTLSNHLLQLVIQDGWAFPSPSVKEHTDAWTQLQTTSALLATPEADRTHFPQCVGIIHRLFEPNDVCDSFLPGHGWPNFNDGEPSAEASGWALSAIARALSLPGLVSPAERDRLLDRLDQVQTALDNCRSRERTTRQPNGAWNLFAQQEDPGQANIYITVLVCQGLLDLRRADLPWHKSQPLRDRLLADTLDWLLRRFDGQGWSARGRQEEEFNDGLTLQIFATLLRAEADGVVELPRPVLDQIPRHLADCGTRPLNYQISVALFGVPFRNHLGKVVPRPQRPVRMLWYPWALSCAASWMLRCERMGAPHDAIVRTRRVLGHLVLALGDAAVEEAKTGYTYVIAETLIGLNALDLP